MAASAMPARGLSGARLRAMPQTACATTATATIFSPWMMPSATGPEKEPEKSAKRNSAIAEGNVNPSQAAIPPASPLREIPRAKPIWLLAGPGRN
jgi:hypothetical protein